MPGQLQQERANRHRQHPRTQAPHVRPLQVRAATRGTSTTCTAGATTKPRQDGPHNNRPSRRTNRPDPGGPHNPNTDTCMIRHVFEPAGRARLQVPAPPRTQALLPAAETHANQSVRVVQRHAPLRQLQLPAPRSYAKHTPQGWTDEATRAAGKTQTRGWPPQVHPPQRDLPDESSHLKQRPSLQTPSMRDGVPPDKSSASNTGSQNSRRTPKGMAAPPVQ